MTEQDRMKRRETRTPVRDQDKACRRTHRGGNLSLRTVAESRRNGIAACRAAIPQLQRSVGNRAVAQLLAGQLEQSPVLDVVGKGSGSPLDSSLQVEMSQRLGADFSSVRIHTGSRASESAAAVDAQAYTVGNEIVFGPDAYSPETPAGKQTIAHELTHVMQQSRGAVSGTDNGDGVAISDPRDSFEQAAKANAAEVMRKPFIGEDDGTV